MESVVEISESERLRLINIIAVKGEELIDRC